MFMKKILLLTLCSAPLFAPSDANFNQIRRANRRANAGIIRNLATSQESRQAMQLQPTNGDEQRYADKRGSYCKGLAQLDTGFVDVTVFNSMVFAMLTGNPTNFNQIILGVTPAQQRLRS